MFGLGKIPTLGQLFDSELWEASQINTYPIWFSEVVGFSAQTDQEVLARTIFSAKIVVSSHTFPTKKVALKNTKQSQRYLPDSMKCWIMWYFAAHLQRKSLCKNTLKIGRLETDVTFATNAFFASYSFC